MREGFALNHPPLPPERLDGALKGRLALGTAMIGTAFSSVLNKYALSEGLHPIWINAYRLGFALAVMVLFSLLRRRAIPVRISGRAMRLSMLSGAFLAAHFACWVYALKLTDALAAAAIWSTYLFMTALGAMLLLKEKIPVPAFFAMALAFAGVIICNLGWNGTKAAGNLFALGAAATQAGYFLCGRTVRRDTDTFSYTLVVYGVAFLLLVTTGLALRLPAAGMTPPAIAAAMGLAVFCTLLGHSLASYALKSLSATTVSIGMLMEVVTGPLMVFLLMGEAPGRFTLIGGALIFAAVAWYFRIDWRRQAVSQEPPADAL